MQRRVLALAVVVLGGLLPVGTAPSAASLEVIVQTASDRDAAFAAVHSVRGRVTDVLPIVDGVSAVVPAHSLGRLRAAVGITAVTLNALVTTASDGALADRQEGGHAPTGQPAVLATGAGVLHARGLTGGHKGSAPTRIALLDTGVDLQAVAVGDLQGRVLRVEDPFGGNAAGDVPCVNLSSERGCDDGFGHGTFMAGVIAGSGRASDGAFVGTAPGADVISIKVAGRTGETDVRRILKGLEWVVSFRDRYDIGVLNLSLGVTGTTDPARDPVMRAVQRVWDAGIVVVAAAGNAGAPADAADSTITKPGSAPLVLTVGATDDRGTVGVADDVVPAYTSRGTPGTDKPDLVAPGTHLVSLRAVGSTTDAYGTLVDGTYRLGSGTSMSTAVVSGVVALVRQAEPTWTPDQVKAALRETARPVIQGQPSAVGRGLLDAPAALLVTPSDQQQPRPDGTAPAIDEQSWWTGSDWTGSDWTGSDWTGSDWTGSDWTGSDWTGSDWTGSDWTGSDWTGSDWTGSDWTGADPARGNAR